MHLHLVIGNSPSYVASGFYDTEFYITGFDQPFPCDGWIDSAYPVICEWATMVTLHIRAKSDKFSLHFHEGPYRIDFVRIGNETYHVYGVNQNKPNRPQTNEIVCTSDELRNMICDAIQKMTKAIDLADAGRFVMSDLKFCLKQCNE